MTSDDLISTPINLRSVLNGIDATCDGSAAKLLVVRELTDQLAIVTPTVLPPNPPTSANVSVNEQSVANDKDKPADDKPADDKDKPATTPTDSTSSADSTSPIRAAKRRYTHHNV